MSNKLGRTCYAQAVTLGWWKISQIARYKIIGRGRQSNGKERLVVRIG